MSKPKKYNIEKQFQETFIRWLNYHHIEYFKIHSGKIYLPLHTPSYIYGTNHYEGDFYSIQVRDSFSDILVFSKGEVLFIELKRDTGYLRKNQKEMFYKLVDDGFQNNCFVLRPKNWEQLKLNYKNSKNIKEALILTLGVNQWMGKNKPKLLK